MRKKSIAIVSLLLAASTLVTACGKTSEESSSSTASSSGSSESNKSEPVEISMFVSSIPEFDPETFPSIPVLEEKLNVKLSYEVPPSSSYTEKLQILLTSGDYPDVIMFQNTTDKAFIDAVKNGVVVPVTQWVSKAENLQAHTSEITWDAMKAMNDDDIYAVPRSTPFRADGFAYRKDWTDKLGITISDDLKVTKDELYTMLERFTKEDPDGNGKADTYGFTLNTDADGNLVPQFTALFGLMGWQEVQGEEYQYMKPQYSRISTTYKDALEFTAKLWEEGIMDPNAPTQKSNDDRVNRFKQGSIGTIADFGANILGYETELKKIKADSELKYFFTTNSDGEVEGDAFGTGYWWVNAITSAAKGKEETIVDLFDYMLSDDGWDLIKYGPEGVTWNTVNGARVMDETEYNKISLPRAHFAQVRRNDDPNFFFSPLLPAETTKEAAGWVDTALKTAVTSMDRGYRPAVADEPAYIDYNKKLASTVTKIILGSEPISAYDTALDEWYKNGGEDYVKQMNDYIAATQK